MRMKALDGIWTHDLYLTKVTQSKANKNFGNVGIDKNAKKHGVIVLPGDEYDFVRYGGLEEEVRD
jgi:hypothetical protein